MNSLIQLSQSPLSVLAPESLSSARRVHVSLSHGSVSVPQWYCKRSHLCSRPLYVKCALDRFSEGPKMKDVNNGKKKKKMMMMMNDIVRGMGRASLVLTCVLGAFTLSGKMNPKSNIAYANVPWFGQESRGSVTSQGEGFLKSEFADANEIEALKLYAMALSYLNKDDEGKAVTIMRKERERFATSSIANQLSIALIEVLLFQKKRTEAMKEIQKLLKDIDENGGFCDVPKKRIYLLQAIAESEPKKAGEAWKRYQEESESAPFSVKP